MYLNRISNKEFCSHHPWNNRRNNYYGESAAFGCSNTWGMGVEDNQEYPHLLKLWNGGDPGDSNDGITRRAIQYILEFKPKFICVLWTNLTRREWINESNDIQRYLPNRSKTRSKTHCPKKQWNAFSHLINDNYDAYVFERNQLLLHSICKLHNVHIYEDNFRDSWSSRKFSIGLDNIHPGKDWHAHQAVRFYNLIKEHSND